MGSDIGLEYRVLAVMRRNRIVQWWIRSYALFIEAYGSFQSAWRTLEGIETMNMIRKGRVRRVAKGNVVAKAQFIVMLFAIAA
jgi:hypothetical protein